MDNQEKQIAWITGGSRGIGIACAEALGKFGYRIVISARNEVELKAAADSLAKEGVEAVHVVCDVGNEDSVKQGYQEIIRRFGGSPHLLLNNAGVSPWSTFMEMTTEELDEALAVNVRGMFLCSREVLPAMYERQDGAVIQMLSVASTKAYKNGAGYVASKFAALGFTNALRDEARKHGVRVISVMPGAVETALWDPEQRAEFHEKMMQPVDIANAIVDALRQPKRALIEEILIRPLGGDL